jgi:hypothetical protein
VVFVVQKGDEASLRQDWQLGSERFFGAAGDESADGLDCVYGVWGVLWC